MDHDQTIAAAQARRDRDRLRAAQAEIEGLRARIHALDRSPSRRLFGPARRTLRLLRRLAGQPALPHEPPAPHPRPDRGLALVIDNEWPQPDRDSGSVDIVLLTRCLDRLGFRTLLAAATQHEGDQPARDRLQAQGIRCLTPADAPSVERFLTAHGGSLDLLVLCRVYCGGAFLETAQRHSRQARLVFDSIDLNYLREERRATLLNDTALLGLIGQIRAREEHVIQSCDATLVVSQAEADLLARTMPAALVAAMPLARPIAPPETGFEGRSGIGFIGGFGHSPNLDAVQHFLAGTWPLVRQAIPGATFAIVGAAAPPGLAEGQGGSVQVLGHLPDVGPWFESLRLTVAPLRFGAGAKGKVASSLAAGVPCIASPIAAEGMELAEDSGVLVADTPQAFADAIARAYTDPALWARLSAGALAYARRTLSEQAWQDRLDATLRRIGV